MFVLSRNLSLNNTSFKISYNQTCILIRSPLDQRQSGVLKPGDILKEIQFIWIFWWQEKKKMWPFNTGLCFRFMVFNSTFNNISNRQSNFNVNKTTHLRLFHSMDFERAWKIKSSSVFQMQHNGSDHINITDKLPKKKTPLSPHKKRNSLL